MKQKPYIHAPNFDYVDVEAKEMPAKSPKHNSFPHECPPACSRNCKKFYEAHTRLVSFAMYATQDPAKAAHIICLYAFSCGMEINSMPFALNEGETPEQLIVRAVPAVLQIFTEMAEHDLKEGAIRN